MSRRAIPYLLRKKHFLCDESYFLRKKCIEFLLLLQVVIIYSFKDLFGIIIEFI